MGACLLDYMMSFINESEIYIEKYSHPHPVVRLLNILLNITNYFSLLPKYKNIGIELCPISLLRAIINFHNKLSSKNIFPIGLSTYIYENNINTPRLLSYINTINNWEEFNGHTDAMTVWNRHVDSNNN